MEFRQAFQPQPFTVKIEHHHPLMLLGSCFTENIGAKLRNLKFSLLENPHGILFNPISISQAIEDYINNRQYTQNDLFYFNESWHSWNHHSRFSDPNDLASIDRINQAIGQAHQFIQQTEWILITLGSAFVYQIPQNLAFAGKVFSHHWVANCHKVPTDKFVKVLLQPDDIASRLRKTIDQVKAINPKVKFIFTISPVRHLRDGFIENNRSKAALIQAVHQLVNEENGVFYFPAYELVMDDLRDYRFFAEDMVHPNYLATNYVWEKFLATAMPDDKKALFKEIVQISHARQHKPFNPHSNAHQTFKQQHLQRIQMLLEKYPYINFSEEIDFFSR
jgi:hypothetical protein